MEFEIGAVASTFDNARDISSREDRACDDDKANGDVKDGKNGVEASANDFTLQQALAADRLMSLKRTKAQLEKELSEFHQGDTIKGVDKGKMLADLVKEEPRLKKKSKEVKKSGKKKENSQRAVSFSDDADFDSILDAASSGFVETVS